MPNRTAAQSARLSHLARKGRTAHVETARRLMEAEQRAPGSVAQAAWNAWNSGKISWGEMERMVRGGRAMIKTPLMLRWKRARRIRLEDVKIQELYQPEDGWVEVEGWVASQSGDLGYKVGVTFVDNRVVLASCSCPDFNKEMRGRGVPLLHGVRVCKHALAAAIKVRRQFNLDLLALVMHLAGWEWVMEFGGGAWVHGPA